MICQQGGRLFVLLSSEGIDPVTLKAPRGVAASSSHHLLVNILAAVAAVVQRGAPLLLASGLEVMQVVKPRV